MENLIIFKNVLFNASNFTGNESLFLPNNGDWSLNSLCCLFNLDELEDDEEIPQIAIKNNLDYALSMADLQDIVDNAKQQYPNCSETDLFRAFMYYYKNDAFITFSE